MKFGIDLSYMKLKVSRNNEYTDGSPCFDFKQDEWAGTHTNLGYIIVNPDIDLTMKHYNYQGSLDDFINVIIAHELAHEIWQNDDIMSVYEKQQILLDAIDQNFTTSYLETVRDEVRSKETFCEYMAKLITDDE